MRGNMPIKNRISLGWYSDAETQAAENNLTQSRKVAEAQRKNTFESRLPAVKGTFTCVRRYSYSMVIQYE